MAGVSDICPRCGTAITAPALPTEEAVVTPPLVLDEPVAPAEVEPPKQPSLLPPPELVEASSPVIAPRKKILQQDAELPITQPSLPKPKEPDLFPPVTPSAEAIESLAADSQLGDVLQTPEVPAVTAEAASPLTSMTALTPLTVPEDHELESSATAPGMGEILAEQSSSNTLLQNQDARPWLHGPFLTTAGPKKRLPGIFSSRYIVAIISFLLVDLFIFLIFRDQITGFFQPESKAVPIPESSPSPAIPQPAASDLNTSGPKVEDSAPPLKTEEPKALAPLPMEKAVPAETVQFTPVPVATEAPKALAIPPLRLNPVPAQAQSALDALKLFLEAPTWSERVTHVQKPDAVRPLMEQYASKTGDGPIIAGAVSFIERFVNDKGAHCTFEVSGGTLPHAVIAIVDQPSSGPARVDWEAFVEFKDDLLLKFLESNGIPNQKFRVTMQRIHYFDNDVPEQDSKDSFGIRQPNAPFEGHIFVDKKSPLGAQLATQLPWGKDLLIIAELTWKTNGKNHWVELQEITSYGWRY